MCNNNVLVLGQCGSPTACSNETQKVYTHSCTLAEPYTWSDNDIGISLDENTLTPAEQCRRGCEYLCSGRNPRVDWSGCKAFTSFVEGPTETECKCYGYDSKPDFDEGDYLSGWCEN